MKKRFRFISALFTAVLICTFALSLSACGDPDATIGEGGIVPDGNYKRMEVADSSFYVPSESNHTGTKDAFEIYAFSEGNFIVVVEDTRAKVQRVSRSAYDRALQKQIKETGQTYTLDDYKFYKLSGLWIRAVEVTLFNGDSSIKKYQYSYNSDNKMVTVTIEYNSIDVAEDSDFPAKLLYSIALI